MSEAEVPSFIVSPEILLVLWAAFLAAFLAACVVNIFIIQPIRARRARREQEKRWAAIWAAEAERVLLRRRELEAPYEAIFQADKLLRERP